LDLRVQIPIAAGSGWSWWDDAHVSRPVVEGQRYEHAVSAVADGWLPISLYPYGGLGSRSSGAGLALGLPPDTPQLGEIAYDAGRRVLEVTFHLGISPAAPRLANQATFHAELFRVDPEWGFRSIIQRFHDIHETLYRGAVWLFDYRGGSQGDYSSPAGVQQVLDEDAHNMYTAEYTSSDLPLKVAPANEPRPSLEDLLAKLDQMAQSPDESVRAAANAIRLSALVETNGEWWLKEVTMPLWDRTWWVGCWLANMDPDIEGGKAQWNVHNLIDGAFGATGSAGAHLDGVQIDNFMATAAFDLRPEALAVADRTLGYSPNTYQPAIHNGFAEHEYMTWLRRHLDAAWGEDRAITVNFWGLGHPNYLAPFVDGFGLEGTIGPMGIGGNWNLEILDYRRAIAYGRPLSFANQTTGFTLEQSELFIGLAVLFGIPSSVGPVGHDWEPGAEDAISKAAELVHGFWAAGWEPVTCVRSTSPEVLIERFGRVGLSPGPSAPGGIFFTVHNAGNTTQQAALTIDLRGLGLTEPAAVHVTDLELGLPVHGTRNGTSLQLTLQLNAHQTRVLRLLTTLRARRTRGRAIPSAMRTSRQEAR
ncbi:MAG: hypothetical protein GXP47_00715, partial [Acidobacteria bacterium]|nr:hypothetical protein [Acidobacteriota bacterium]